MAETLLTARRKTGATLTSHEDAPDGAQLREMWFDATLSESETISVEWSEHPIESGATVADHAVVRPPELSLEGFITRTPLSMSTELDNLDPNYLDAALDALRGMTADREPVLIVTGLRAYEDYRITSLTVSRSPEDGQAARVSLSLRPVQIVEAGTVLLPPLPIKPAKKNAAAGEASQGTQSPTDASGEGAGGRTSLLKGGLDGSGLSGLMGI
jgi:hypothetical protein